MSSCLDVLACQQIHLSTKVCWRFSVWPVRSGYDQAKTRHYSQLQGCQVCMGENSARYFHNSHIFILFNSRNAFTHSWTELVRRIRWRVRGARESASVHVLIGFTKICEIVICCFLLVSVALVYLAFEKEQKTTWKTQNVIAELSAFTD